MIAGSPLEERLETAFSTTPSQQEIFSSAYSSADGNRAYNEGLEVRVRARLDAHCLKRALELLGQRHQALRSTFDSLGQFVCVAQVPRIDFEVIRHSSSASSAHDDAMALIDELMRTSLDLIQGPLWKTRLFEHDGESRLVFLFHHIVADGWSQGVLLKELELIYNALASGAGVDLPEAPLFASHAVEESGPEGKKDAPFWKRELTPLPPTIDLPTDRARPKTRTFRASRLDRVFERRLVEPFAKSTAKLGITLVNSVLTALLIQMKRITGQTDQIVGIAIAGQLTNSNESLVGHCVKMLPIRQEVAAAQTFIDVAASVRAKVVDAYEHQAFTFGELVKELPLERDPSRVPLMPVIFNIDQPFDPLTLGSVDCSVRTLPRQAENFELFLNFVPDGGGVLLEATYNTDLFDEATVAEWIGGLEEIFGLVAANPRTPIRDICRPGNASLGSGPERDVQPPLPLQVQGLAVKYPSRPAVRHGGRTLSLGALDSEARRIAGGLRSCGVAPGDRVGLYLERTESLVSAILGVWSLGAAYVPLDPGFPRERLDFMMRDAELGALLTSDGLPELDFTGPMLSMTSALSSTPATELAAVKGEDTAYLIYTSGSTGQPKGVVVSHSNVTNLLDSVVNVPGFRESDVMVAVSTLSFDISVTEVWGPILGGGVVEIASRDTAGDGEKLKNLLVSSSATIFQATPASWRLLLEAGWEGSKGFRAFVTGEPFPADLLEPLSERCSEVWNLYGPTETTVWSSCGELKPGELVHVGRPIANTYLYVLDERLQLVEGNTSGELYIGGLGVAKGYWRRESLTAERFISDPFNGGQMYRTGDLVRWGNRARLEHLGRLDDQVKIRGFRIELGEVETVLAAQPGIKRAVAAVLEVSPGDQRLVGYFVGHASQRELRNAMLQKLPDYMVPNLFIQIETIPLSPNGKVDRKQLPKPSTLGRQAGGQGEQPRTQTEKAIAEIWERALNVSPVGLEDDFFELGGHSLLLIRCAMESQQACDRSVPVQELFASPTVGRWSQLLGSDSDSSALREIPLVERAEPNRYVASFSQRALWVIHEVFPESLGYQIPYGFRIRGNFDVACFSTALRLVIERNESLRTVFLKDQDGLLLQHVVADAAAGLSVSEVEEAALETRIGELLAQPMSLGKGPLMRADVLRLGSTDHCVLLQFHHIIVDLLSIHLAVEELQRYYAELVAGESVSSLGRRTLDYVDFAVWQDAEKTEEALADQVSFWRDRIAQGKGCINLPTTRPRPSGQSFSGTYAYGSLGSDLTGRLRDFARKHRTTVFNVLLSVYSYLLQRYAREEDVIVGVPFANRADSHDLAEVVGLFINTLPVPCSLKGDQSFAANLEEVTQITRQVQAYQDTPLEYIVQAVRPERDPAFNPLFQVGFAVQQPDPELSFANAEVTALPVDNGSSMYDLHLFCLDDQSGAVDLSLLYDDALYDEAHAQSLLERFCFLLNQCLEAPELPLHAHRIATRQDASQIRSWNEASRLNVGDISHPLELMGFESGVVHCGERTLSASQVQDQASVIASALKDAGVKRGDLVGVLMNRQIDLLPTMIGVWMAGGGYLPLDPRYPASWLEYVLEDSGVGVVCTDGAHEPPASANEVRTLDISGLSLGGGVADLAAELSGADDPAYVIYTSGSTGKPKGVVVPNRCVVNFLSSMQERPGICADDHLVAVTTTSFDISVLELFLPLVAGASLTIAQEEQTADPTQLSSLLQSQDATMMQATPSTWRMLVDDNWTCDTSFRILTGGEAVPQDLADRLCSISNQVWNMYGPTETTVWSTCHQLKQGEPVRIGCPIHNTGVHVLDEQLQLLPPGVPGDLYISGAGVTAGYLGKEDLTEEAFLKLGDTETIFYRTGDVARWLSDGTIEYLGRNDHQVKVRGHRIELGQIESVLAQVQGIRQVVVHPVTMGAGDQRLVAYYTADQRPPRTSQLRKNLRRALPSYMVPNVFVQLEELPLTSNGKVDRKQLPKPSTLGRQAGGQGEQPRTQTEKAIAEIWKAMLQSDQIGLDSNFFAAGGHSLLAIKVVAEIEKQIGVRISLRSMVVRSLREIAAECESYAAPDLRVGS